MAGTLQKPRDVIGGLVVMAIGAGFLLFGRELPMGTALRMGPGYFPTILSWIMILLGAALAGLALRKPTVGGTFAGIPWRGLLLITLSIVLFGFTLRGIGVGPAILVVVLATAWASHYASLRSSVPLALGLALFCVVLFIRTLGLPLPTIGPWLSAAYWSRPATVAPASTDPATPPR
jgi:hypothetical protein